MVHGVHVIPTSPTQLAQRIIDLGIDVVQTDGGYHACDTATASSQRVDGVPVVVRVAWPAWSPLNGVVSHTQLASCVRRAAQVWAASPAIALSLRSHGVPVPRLAVAPVARVDTRFFRQLPWPLASPWARSHATSGGVANVWGGQTRCGGPTLGAWACLAMPADQGHHTGREFTTEAPPLRRPDVFTSVSRSHVGVLGGGSLADRARRFAALVGMGRGKNGATAGGVDVVLHVCRQHPASAYSEWRRVLRAVAGGSTNTSVVVVLLRVRDAARVAAFGVEVGLAPWQVVPLQGVAHWEMPLLMSWSTILVQPGRCVSVAVCCCGALCGCIAAATCDLRVNGSDVVCLVCADGMGPPRCFLRRIAVASCWRLMKLRSPRPPYRLLSRLPL